ncbi:hypothetical protein BJ165DRAFT_1456448 [Panaeolus papilionaceus]|nr:hypothetical protein BJ165DRAFT_1456448 [Panaeolus papilionaceus]
MNSKTYFLIPITTRGQPARSGHHPSLDRKVGDKSYLIHHQPKATTMPTPRVLDVCLEAR